MPRPKMGLLSLVEKESLTSLLFRFHNFEYAPLCEIFKTSETALKLRLSPKRAILKDKGPLSTDEITLMKSLLSKFNSTPVKFSKGVPVSVRLSR